MAQPGCFTGSRDDGEMICEQIRALRAKPIAEPIGAKRGCEDAAKRPPAPAKAGGTNRMLASLPAKPLSMHFSDTLQAGLVKYPGWPPP
jgi:hypothetical protein